MMQDEATMFPTPPTFRADVPSALFRTTFGGLDDSSSPSVASEKDHQKQPSKLAALFQEMQTKKDVERKKGPIWSLSFDPRKSFSGLGVGGGVVNFLDRVVEEEVATGEKEQQLLKKEGKETAQQSQDGDDEESTISTSANSTIPVLVPRQSIIFPVFFL
jgi:hypothetical protein